MFALSKKSMSHMNGVHTDLKRVAQRAIQITKIDFGIPETGGKRSAEMQKALFDEGLSMCDGYDKKSNHQSGNALDFYAYVDGNASWQKEHLSQVAAAFLQAAIELNVKIRWGGLFNNFVDQPHLELM